MTTTQNYSPTAPTTRRTRRSGAQVAADARLVRRIEAALYRDPVAVVRALELLYAAQTADEKCSATTRHINARGFRQDHAKRGTWLVSVIIADGRRNGLNENALLRGSALEIGRTIALRYARTQLLGAAKAVEAERAYLQALSDQASCEAAEDAAANAGTLGEPRC